MAEKDTEVLIEDAYLDGEVLETVNCKICGKPMRLWLNGGELDQVYCCGYRYYSEAKGYRILVKKDTI